MEPIHPYHMVFNPTSKQFRYIVRRLLTQYDSVMDLYLLDIKNLSVLFKPGSMNQELVSNLIYNPQNTINDTIVSVLGVISDLFRVYYYEAQQLNVKPRPIHVVLFAEYGRSGWHEKINPYYKANRKASLTNTATLAHLIDRNRDILESLTRLTGVPVPPGITRDPEKFNQFVTELACNLEKVFLTRLKDILRYHPFVDLVYQGNLEGDYIAYALVRWWVHHCPEPCNVIVVSNDKDLIECLSLQLETTVHRVFMVRKLHLWLDETDETKGRIVHFVTPRTALLYLDKRLRDYAHQVLVQTQDTEYETYRHLIQLKQECSLPPLRVTDEFQISGDSTLLQRWISILRYDKQLAQFRSHHTTRDLLYLLGVCLASPHDGLLVPLYLAMAGDSADNLHGVGKLGETGAGQVLLQAKLWGVEPSDLFNAYWTLFTVLLLWYALCVPDKVLSLAEITRGLEELYLDTYEVLKIHWDVPASLLNYLKDASSWDDVVNHLIPDLPVDQVQTYLKLTQWTRSNLLKVVLESFVKPSKLIPKNKTHYKVLQAVPELLYWLSLTSLQLYDDVIGSRTVPWLIEATNLGHLVDETSRRRYHLQTETLQTITDSALWNRLMEHHVSCPDVLKSQLYHSLKYNALCTRETCTHDQLGRG